MAAVFIEGFIFVILAVTGVRSKIIRMIPKSVMLATSAGIGLYLAHIGLQKSEGLNVVTYDSATIVTLGESLVPSFITDTASAACPQMGLLSCLTCLYTLFPLLENRRNLLSSFCTGSCYNPVGT